MDRFRLVAVVIVLAAVSGCIDTKDPEEIEKWGPSQWKQAVREDQQRLKSEDERTSLSPVRPIRGATDALVGQIARVFNYLTGNTPFDAAKAMIDPDFPDRRRQAVMYFAKHKYGRQDPYVAYYAEMARTDADHTVRAMAIRALNRSRARDHTAVYVQALGDRHELVRLEAVKALANVPDPAATETLLRLLENDESMDVRVASADALRAYRTRPVAAALIRSLGDRDFGVGWQSRKSLKLMTGQDFRYDQSRWLGYFRDNQNPFG